MERMSGIYVELSYLEAFLNFGQILLVSLCFLGDTDSFWDTLEAYYLKLRGISKHEFEQNLLSETTRKLCEQFRLHHLDNCRQIIGSDRIVDGQLYKDAFYGSTFVKWLIRVGLAHDQREAVSYANHLIDGKVLRNVSNILYFDDKQVIFTIQLSQLKCNRCAFSNANSIYFCV